MIYKQTKSWPCGYYATLVALQGAWLNISEKQLFEIFNKRFKGILPSILAGAIYLKSIWAIQDFVEIYTTRGIDYAMRRKYTLAAYTVNNLSFDSVRNPPYIQDWSGKSDHAFCIVPKESTQGTWAVQDSQGDKFADHGYWYIKKEDFTGKRKFAPPIRFII